MTVITSLAPPYTPFLGQYANDITDKLRVTVVLRDSRVASYPVKLIMSLEQVGYGEVMRTAAYATTPVFYIDNGSVTLGGADLASLFLPANIEFTGNTGQMYLNTGRIPDGLYRIGFSIVDAMRQDVVLASTGYSAPSWFVLNQPPLPTLPGNDEEVTLTGIQNVRFSWTPRHLGSGNTAFATEYLFQLYEMRVANVGKDRTVLSTAPVYTTTTTSTSLFLTDGDFPLEQGVSYVWRVTADDGIDGFTLFENKGRSETRAFTYGCLCPVPQSPLPYTVTSDRATIEWVPDPLHMEYETRFRLKGDNDGLWHSRGSYLGETVIDKVLSPLTSYEYQVRARCFNGEWSDYSPVNWFTTTGVTGSGIECGKSDVMAEITNLVPKPMLYAGEVITYGDWQLVLTEVTGGNGLFSGKCTVAVPLFNYARVNMFFDNIRVNELNQVTSGVVRSKSSDDSRMMVEDITDYFNEGDQIGNIIDNVAVAELTLGFEAGDDMRASVSSDGTTITIISGDNSQTFTVENIDEGTTVIDTQGNIYAVSDNGTATLIGKDMAASRGEEDHSNISKAITGTSQGTQTGETDAPTGPSPYSAKISFTATGRWAIDERDGSYAGSPFDGEYAMFSGAYVPWKLVPEGKSDKLRVTVNGPVPDPGQIRFITATGTEFFAKRNGSDYDLEILGGGERDGYELYVVYEYEAGSSGDDTDAEEEAAGDETGSDTEYQVLGKLNVASYPLIERSVVVVPMYKASVDGLKLVDALDAVYSRYGVTWDIKIDYSFNDDSWDTDGNGLNSGNSGFFSAYTSEMRALNSTYVAKRGITDNTVYLFWFDSTAGDSEGLAGDMPLDSQFGYIFASTAGASVYNTVAHELGHGAFQLRHPFSDSYSLPKYSTGNLMDYSGGTQLVKYQWDLLHDPQTMVAKWMQDEEEGDYYKTTFEDFWIQNINNIACAKRNNEKQVELNAISPGLKGYFEYGEIGKIIIEIPEASVNTSDNSIILTDRDISDYTDPQDGTIHTQIVYKSVSGKYRVLLKIASDKKIDFLSIIDNPSNTFFSNLCNSIPSVESKEAYSLLAQLPVCSYEEIEIENRIKYFEWLSGERWTNNDQEEIILNLLIHVKDRKELYGELYNNPVLIMKLLSSCDGESRQIFIDEITQLCDENWSSSDVSKGDVYIGRVPNSFGSVYSGYDFITYAILNEGSIECSVSNYIGRFPEGMFDWGNVQVLKSISRFSCNPLDPVTIYSCEGDQGIFPLIYPVNLSQQQGNQNVAQQFANTLNYLGVTSSVRILSTGSKLAKSIAIVELTKTGIDVIFNDPQVISTLNQTEEGKEFLKYWQIASVTIDLATIGADILEGIIKHGPEASNALRTAGKSDAADNADDLIEESKTIIYRTSDGIYNINPQDIRLSAQNWNEVKKARFDYADEYYNFVGYKNYDNHLRGIDFDKTVIKTNISKGTYIYQYSLIDEFTGKPKIGDYFYKSKDINVNKLGFSVDDRVMVRVKVDKTSDFLESVAADIEDWDDTGKIFSGGETQLFNPNVEFSDITILK